MKRFYLFNDLPAFSTSNGNIVLFSPYNLSVGLLHEKVTDTTLEKMKKLRFFGIASNTGPTMDDYFDLTLVITNDCNLKCKYCFARGGEKQNYMPIATAKNILRDVFRLTRRKNIKVSFFGGEPTLNFELIKEVVKEVKKLAYVLNKGYSFYITTNGLMAQRKLEFLIDNDFTFVISSDGAPEFQDFLRPTSGGYASSNLVEKTITSLAERKIPFQIRSTISQYNVNSMVENVRYFGDLGVKTLHFEPITNAGRAKSNAPSLLRADPQKYIVSFLSALDTAKERNMSLVSSSYMNFLAPTYKFCDAMAGSRLIGSYNGDITLCVEVQDNCHPYSEKAIVGHADERTGISINHERYEKILENVPTKQNSVCNKCFAKYSCGGGCPVKNYYYSGSDEADPYRCSITSGLFGNILERIYHESIDNSNVIYESKSISLYRMLVPEEIWMKRKVSRISKILGEIIMDLDSNS